MRYELFELWQSVCHHSEMFQAQDPPGGSLDIKVVRVPVRNFHDKP